jgi:hypothetical protein
VLPIYIRECEKGGVEGFLLIYWGNMETEPIKTEKSRRKRKKLEEKGGN